MSIVLGLMPHGYCFLWDFQLTSLHVITDGAIAIAYFSIPAVMYWNRDRATEEDRPVVLMFAAFILTCGVGHVLSVWNIWHGNYWIEGLWKIVIAGVSLATAWLIQRKISHLMGAHRRLIETEIIANTDRLTGLTNRRGLEQAWQSLSLRTAEPNRNSHVLMLIDLDHFKTINDTHGHLVGDRLLQSTAQILSRHTRSADIVTRLGGDEFAIILVGCSLPQGNRIAESILADIADLSIEGAAPIDQAQSLVTASIGLHRLQATGIQNFDDIFRHTDQLLYVSKQEGRDRVTVTPEEIVNEA